MITIWLSGVIVGFFACLLITSVRTNEGIKDDTAEFSTNMFHTFQRSSKQLLCEKTNKTSVDLVHIQVDDKLLYCRNTLGFEKHNGFYDKRKRKVGARGIFEN